MFCIFVLFTLYLTQCLSLYISVELLIIFEILSSSVSPSLQQIFCENIQYFVGIFKYFVGIFKYFVGILKYFVRIFKYSVGIFKYFVGIIKYFVGLFKYYVEILSRIVNSSPSIPTHVTSSKQIPQRILTLKGLMGLLQRSRFSIIHSDGGKVGGVVSFLYFLYLVSFCHLLAALSPGMLAKVEVCWAEANTAASTPFSSSHTWAAFSIHAFLRTCSQVGSF